MTYLILVCNMTSSEEIRFDIESFFFFVTFSESQARQRQWEAEIRAADAGIFYSKRALGHHISPLSAFPVKHRLHPKWSKDPLSLPRPGAGHGAAVAASHISARCWFQ